MKNVKIGGMIYYLEFFVSICNFFWYVERILNCLKNWLYSTFNFDYKIWVVSKGLKKKEYYGLVIFMSIYVEFLKSFFLKGKWN